MPSLNFLIAVCLCLPVKRQGLLAFPPPFKLHFCYLDTSRAPSHIHETTQSSPQWVSCYLQREGFLHKLLHSFVISLPLEPHLNFILCDSEDIIHKVPYDRPGVQANAGFDPICYCVWRLRIGGQFSSQFGLVAVICIQGFSSIYLHIRSQSLGRGILDTLQLAKAFCLHA